MSRHHGSMLAAAIVVLALAGCDDSPTGSSSPPNWIDPRIAPQVLATYPLDGGTGPFELFIPGSYLAPHFIVQMNKAINRFEFRPNWFTVQGFDRPVTVFLLQSFEPYPERQRTPDPLVGVMALGVVEGFQGSARYRIGRTYTVTVETTLEDATGRHPDQPYSFSFQPEPFFRVTSVLPEDGDEQVHPSTNLLVRFNSAIDSTTFASIQLSPPSPGNWTLPPYDSTAASFVHVDPFPYDTQYSLRVRQDAADVDGNRLQEEFVSQFHVVPFKVVSNEPPIGQVDIQPTSVIAVVTSGPYDPTTVQSAFSIEPAVAGSFTTDWSRFTFQPHMPLAVATHYTVRISTALRAADGTPLAAAHTFSFTTDHFRVVNTWPYDRASEIPRNVQIVVNCNLTTDITSAAAAFSISPPVAGAIEPGPQGFAFTFRPQMLLAPLQNYEVTISTGLQSYRGDHLPAPNRFVFRTGG